MSVPVHTHVQTCAAAYEWIGVRSVPRLVSRRLAVDKANMYY